LTLSIATHLHITVKKMCDENQERSKRGLDLDPGELPQIIDALSRHFGETEK